MGLTTRVRNIFRGQKTRSTWTYTDSGGTSTEFTIVDGIAPAWQTDHYDGGMGIPGAYRAATLISDLLGSVPWHAYRLRGDKPVEMLDPTPPLLEQPSPPETRVTTFSSMALDLLWHGNAVAIVAARNSEGHPTAIFPVPARMVGVRRVGPGSISGLPIGTVEYSIGNLTLGSDDVIHIKGPASPGALRGMGVLEVHFNTLNLAVEQNRQARSISRHGVPTGVLKSENPDLTEAEATDLKVGWLNSQRDRTVAVLNATTDFRPLAWNPEELQLVEARKFTLHEIALIFGIPASFLNVETSNRTYRNDETEGINLVKFSLSGHLARFEQEFSRHLPRGTYAKANLDALLRAATLERYQAHAIALGQGFLTINEVRELEDRPPLPVQPALPPSGPHASVTDGEEVNTQ